MAEGFQGFDRVARRIGQLATDVKHVERPLKEAGEYVVGSIKKNFLVGGRPSKWKALAASTVAQRRRGRGRGGIKILIDTAKMMNALDKKVTTDAVRVGLNAVQARRQHSGYSGGSGRGHSRTPARAFVMLQRPEDVNAIGKIFSRHIARK
jgi:phage gpG-like protein